MLFPSSLLLRLIYMLLFSHGMLFSHVLRFRLAVLCVILSLSYEGKTPSNISSAYMSQALKQLQSLRSRAVAQDCSGHNLQICCFLKQDFPQTFCLLHLDEFQSCPRKSLMEIDNRDCSVLVQYQYRRQEDEREGFFIKDKFEFM